MYVFLRCKQHTLHRIEPLRNFRKPPQKPGRAWQLGEAEGERRLEEALCYSDDNNNNYYYDDYYYYE